MGVCIKCENESENLGKNPSKQAKPQEKQEEKSKEIETQINRSSNWFCTGKGKNNKYTLGRPNRYLLHALMQPLQNLFIPAIFTAFCLTNPSAADGQFLSADAPSGGIRINQIGYSTLGPKIAVLDSDLLPGQRNIPFYIIALNQFADTVYRGQLQLTGTDLYSQKANMLADFTKFTTGGHYYLSIPGQGTSYPFLIEPQPYNAVLTAAIKAYYYNRASMELRQPFAGKWARMEGHPDTTVFIHSSAASKARPEGTVISAPQGWYDAGDYNKYIVNAAISMNTLLYAMEEYPTVFDKRKLNIPESADLLPDILNELLYNLRWMLKMQDPGDGGVYHKLTSASFDGMEMPQKDHDKRYVVQKSTAATLDFVSVMATAARILPAYSAQVPGLLDSLQMAAKRAWGWADAHPDVLYDQDALNKKYRPKITTGAYGDKNLSDEWYQAACSMLLSAKDPTYLAAVEKYTPAPSVELSIPSWNSVAAIGAICLTKINRADFEYNPKWTPTQLSALATLQRNAVNALLHLADRLTLQTNPGFKTVMGGRIADFKWGSNSEAAGQGWILMEAYRLTGTAIFKLAANSNLDYLLGRNATGYCFVTGFGSLSPMHPHHRVSVSDKINDPVPGFLVGGPNPDRQDNVKGYPSKRADLSYIDNDQAYSVNEVAINWNAPFVYLLAAIQSYEASPKNK